LAAVLFQQGEFGQAAGHFQKAVTLAPDNAQFSVNLGNTWLRMGKTNDAVTCFQRALQLQPDNENVRRKLDTLQR